VIPKLCSVYVDLAASAPSMNRLFVTTYDLSVFIALDIKEILARICSSLT